MSFLRLLSIASLLLLSLSGQAIARQYASPGAYPYAVPQHAYTPYAGARHPYPAAGNAYNPYARAPQPYYPANGYPAQPMRPGGYRQPGYAYARPPVAPAAKTTAKASVKNNAGSGKQKPRRVDNDNTGDGVVLSENKQDFIETLLPHIEKENQRLSKLRRDIIGLFTRVDNGKNSAAEKKSLQKLAGKYRVDGDPSTSQSARAELLRKIDIIPSSLALAQAANESAWGKSRFATEANNLFGIWTYDESKGLKPKKREPGKTHLVRIFANVGDSVGYYMHTLNSHPAYETLREIRGQLRESRQVIDGHELASGLEKYSAKGQKYIELIQHLIRQHEWARLDSGKQQA